MLQCLRGGERRCLEGVFCEGCARAASPIEIYGIEYGNGFTFEPGNVEELRKYLKILIYDDKLRHEMGKKSSLLVKEKLNWASITTSYLDTYSQVIKKQ